MSRKKKMLGLALALSFAATQSAFAAPRDVITAGETVGDDIEVVTAGDDAPGTVFDVGNTSLNITAGNNLSITTNGNYSYGAYVAGTTNQVQIGNGLIVNTSGSEAYGVYNAYNSSGSTINIGDNARITTSGGDGHGIYNDDANNGIINVGNGANIQTTGDGAIGVYQEGTGGQTNINGDITIHTTGNAAYGAFNGGRGGSQLNFYGETSILTEGNDGHGVYTERDSEGTITFYDKATIQANGTGAAAVWADSTGSSIEFKTDATISVADTVGGFSAISEKGGRVLGNPAKYLMTGNVAAYDAGSTVDFSFNTGSVLTGSSYESGGGAITFNMLDNSIWNVTSDSGITNLNFANNTSQVNFVSPTGYSSLSITSLTGNGGNFGMRVDIPNQVGDKLYISDSGTGSHKLNIVSNGSASVNGTERLVVVDTFSGSGTFTMDNAIELGGYQYNLRQVPEDTTDWELYGKKNWTPIDPSNPVINPNTPASSHAADAGMSVFSSSYLLNYTEMNTLMQRMGDLHQDNQNGNIWARVHGGKFKRDGDGFLRGFNMDYWGVQVGADKKLVRKEGNIYVGGMFGYSDGDIDYTRGDGSIDSKSVAAYGTYVGNNGFYTDLVLKYGWMRGDFRVVGAQGEVIKAKGIDSDGITASLEVGQRIHLDKEIREGWYVEPQAQLTIGHYGGDDFRASNGLQINTKSYNSVLGRLGANLGYEIKGGTNPINAYAKLSLVHEFDGDMDYRLNGSKESTDYGDTWWVYGLGVTARVGERHNIYLDVERTGGGDFTQKWALNAGYRFQW